jgi:hypothetical protein
MNIGSIKMRYPDEIVVGILHEMRRSLVSNEEFLRNLREKTGFERVQRSHIVGWEHQHGIPVDASKPITGRPARKKVGVKVDAQFEAQIVDSLLFREVCRAESAERVEVVANAIYSYDIIRAMAKKVADEMPDGHPAKKLMFSTGWVQRFLKRNQLRRLRVTTNLSCKRPPASEIQAFLKEVQDHQQSNSLTPFDILSVDETGIFYGFGPTHQYVTRMESRAAAPTSKDRFTVVIGARGTGELLPPFIIAKCSSKANLKDPTSINKLKAKGDIFRGWLPKRWKRTVDGEAYERFYLQGPMNEIVIQHPSAWADTISTMMFLDLMIGDCRRVAVVWDNCAPHRTSAVRALAKELSIDLFYLPPNMTDRLQVVDLAINAPLKMRCRMERGKQLVSHLSMWKAERQINPTAPLQFPRSTLLDGIRVVVKAFAEKFSDSFKDGIHRTFVKVSLLPNAGGDFLPFPTHDLFTKPTVAIRSGADEPVTAAEFLCDVDIADEEEMALIDTLVGRKTFLIKPPAIIG